MRIDSAGKVLINSSGTQRTTNLATCKLQVYDSSIGLASNTAFTPQVALFSAGTTVGAAGYFLATRTRGSYEAPAAIQENDFVGNLAFSGYDGATFYANASISGYADGAVSTGTVPLALQFSTGSAGQNTRMVISSAGNVGIGTTSPAGKLDVNGSFNATSGTIPTLVATTLITTGTGTAAAPAIVPTGDTNTGVFFPAADTIAFSDGGTESLRINSSSNVSIGTATALSRLHVHGDLTLSNATTAASASAGGVTIPATVAGYLSVTINGTSRRIPYFAA
jgi:hypothetical protein